MKNHFISYNNILFLAVNAQIKMLKILQINLLTHFGEGL
jgi:hypothetical protein